MRCVLSDGSTGCEMNACRGQVHIFPVGISVACVINTGELL